MNLNFDHLGASIASLAVVYGINVVGAIIIAIVGWWLAGFVERLMKRMLLDAAHTDATLTVFLSSLAYYSVLVLTFLLILQVVGIQATSLVAVAGATSLAIGLALQGTLSNLAAGVMLLFFRPFRLGDSIEVAGKTGVVRSINIFMTELANSDTVQVLIPNGQIWGTAITNNSIYKTSSREVALTVPVPPTDVRVVLDALRRYVEQEARILPSPAPNVSLANITDKGVEIKIDAWAKTEDAAALKSAIVECFVNVLEKPQQAVNAE